MVLLEVVCSMQGPGNVAPGQDSTYPIYGEELLDTFRDDRMAEHFGPRPLTIVLLPPDLADNFGGDQLVAGLGELPPAPPLEDFPLDNGEPPQPQPSGSILANSKAPVASSQSRGVSFTPEAAPNGQSSSARRPRVDSFFQFDSDSQPQAGWDQEAPPDQPQAGGLSQPPPQLQAVRGPEASVAAAAAATPLPMGVRQPVGPNAVAAAGAAPGIPRGAATATPQSAMAMPSRPLAGAGVLSAPEVTLEIPTGGPLPVWEDKKHKQSGQSARVVMEVPEAIQTLNPAMKTKLILYSMQGQVCQGMLPAKMQELEQQRPLKLVFRHKFSDLSKKTQEQLREQAAAQQAETMAAAAAGATTGGLGLAASTIGGGGGAMAQQAKKIAELQERLRLEGELVSGLKLDLLRQKTERNEKVRDLEAKNGLLDSGQQALVKQVMEVRDEGLRSLERERTLRVKLDQVKYVNGELRQRLEALANHYDEAKREFLGEKEVLMHNLQVERDAHEMTKTELRMHERELHKALSELGVHTAHAELRGSPAPQRVFAATAPRGQLHSQQPQQQQQQPQQRQQQRQREWAATVPAGTDASATWGTASVPQEAARSGHVQTTGGVPLLPRSSRHQTVSTLSRTAAGLQRQQPPAGQGGGGAAAAAGAGVDRSGGWTTGTGGDASSVASDQLSERALGVRHAQRYVRLHTH